MSSNKKKQADIYIFYLSINFFHPNFDRFQLFFFSYIFHFFDETNRKIKTKLAKRARKQFVEDYIHHAMLKNDDSKLKCERYCVKKKNEMK